jgi:hypothetical protein
MWIRRRPSPLPPPDNQADESERGEAEAGGLGDGCHAGPTSLLPAVVGHWLESICPCCAGELP